MTVSDRGEVAVGTQLRGSYRQGLADLLDFTSLPTKVAMLPPGAPTQSGSQGQARRDAILAFG
jgi:hypothetical protein